MYGDDQIKEISQRHDFYSKMSDTGAEYMGFLTGANFALNMINTQRSAEIMETLKEIKSELAALKKQGS